MIGTAALRGRRALLAGAVAVAMTLGSTAAELPADTLPWVDPTGYADRCLAVGAAVNGPGRVDGADLEMFREADGRLGPLTLRRSFDSDLPGTFASSAAGADAQAGFRTFVSWKPPQDDVRGATEGRYDEQIRAWARSVPRTGVFATSYHEPENDMSAEEFVAYQRHLYTVVKEANPTIRWGPVYMAYWWDSSEPSHYIGDPEAWWPGEEYADFAGLDWYGPDPRPMTESASFRTWYRVMEPTGVPLYITEYGQYAVKDGEQVRPGKLRARAEAIRQDAAWIEQHPRIRMWLYWQGVGAQGDWRIQDPEGAAAWREVASSGCAPGPLPAG